MYVCVYFFSRTYNIGKGMGGKVKVQLMSSETDMQVQGYIQGKSFTNELYRAIIKGSATYFVYNFIKVTFEFAYLMIYPERN